MIGICGDIVQTHILDEIRKAKYFSILIDEVADLSRKEQLTLILRFVDKESKLTYKAHFYNWTVVFMISCLISVKLIWIEVHNYFTTKMVVTNLYLFLFI